MYFFREGAAVAAVVVVVVVGGGGGGSALFFVVSFSFWFPTGHGAVRLNAARCVFFLFTFPHTRDCTKKDCSVARYYGDGCLD